MPDRGQWGTGDNEGHGTMRDRRQTVGRGPAGRGREKHGVNSSTEMVSADCGPSSTLTPEAQRSHRTSDNGERDGLCLEMLGKVISPTDTSLPEAASPPPGECPIRFILFKNTEPRDAENMNTITKNHACMPEYALWRQQNSLSASVYPSAQETWDFPQGGRDALPLRGSHT